VSAALVGTADRYQRVADRYSGDTVSTASPQRLVVMLYDRLALDLRRAQQAQLDGLREPAHTSLAHAQEIVAELMSSLDEGRWDAASGLVRLYQWLLKEMITANVRMDAVRTAGCLAVVEPLRDAWQEALDSGGAAQPQGIPVGLTG
jgi:flagellar secretion chaperone FliS